VSPAYLGATIVGNWQLGSNLVFKASKGLDINLNASRLIRFIRDPISVGRELRKPLVEIRLDDWEWLSVSIYSQCPNIKARFLLGAEIKQEMPVGRPIGSELRLP
jgi:hypothetical protein